MKPNISNSHWQLILINEFFMKKTTLFFSILFILIPSFVFAAETNLKIGVIDGEQILRVAPQVAEINKSLEKQFRPEHDKLVKDQQTVQAQIEKLNRDGATMTEKEDRKSVV